MWPTGGVDRKCGVPLPRVLDDEGVEMKCSHCLIPPSGKRHAFATDTMLAESPEADKTRAHHCRTQDTWSPPHGQL